LSSRAAPDDNQGHTLEFAAQLTGESRKRQTWSERSSST
jgi:hypothetical protein